MARSRQRGRRIRWLARLVAMVAGLVIPAAALAAVIIFYGDRIDSALPVSLGFDDGGDSDRGSSDGDSLVDGAIGSGVEPRDCSPLVGAPADPVTGLHPAATLVEISRGLYPCADRVVVAGADPAARWTAAALAIETDAVFLVVDGAWGAPDASPEVDLGSELERLAPTEVTVVGVPSEATAELSGGWVVVEQPSDPAAQRPVLPVPAAGAAPGPVWVVDATAPDLAALLAPAAGSAGASIVPLAPPAAPEATTTTSTTDTTDTADATDATGPASPDGDPFAFAAEVADRLQGSSGVIPIGAFTDLDVWRLELLGSGVELPGGGVTIDPDRRRYIAFYGAAGTSALGVLGEQDPAATLTRMEPLLAEYETGDGVTVVPTFELIATVAAYDAGDDGDYSNEATVEAMRPYVDFAADNGVYVLLDLQPGRTDFLTQAQRYEELLLEPHVGLALDPEWRLEPDQVHMRQLGSVDAVEVNEVSAWLAELVRVNALPQKMFLIHQFQLSMVTNRDAIEERPELSMVIQMDGQGPLGTKYGTLAAVIRGTEDSHFRWGWKNFYDEDTPMATPAQTLAVDPQPVYVSYQ